MLRCTALFSDTIIGRLPVVPSNLSLFCHNLICNSFHTVSLNQVTVVSQECAVFFLSREVFKERLWDCIVPSAYEHY